MQKLRYTTRTSENWKTLPGNFDTVHAEQLFPSSSNAFGIPDLEYIALNQNNNISALATCENEGDIQYLLPYGQKIWQRAEINSVSAIHFHEKDRNGLEHLWQHPKNNARLLSNLNPKAVICPDFSAYLKQEDWNYTLAVWQTYRNRQLAKEWQQTGLAVIPTVNIEWDNPLGYEICFLGLPTQQTSIVAIDTQHLQKQDWGRQLLLSQGFITMLEILKPLKVICYGSLKADLITLALKQFGTKVTLYPCEWAGARRSSKLTVSLSNNNTNELNPTIFSTPTSLHSSFSSKGLPSKPDSPSYAPLPLSYHFPQTLAGIPVMATNQELLSFQPEWMTPFGSKVWKHVSSKPTQNQDQRSSGSDAKLEKQQSTPKQGAIHFYLYDYEFEEVWSYPTKHLETFKLFGAILTPDFSLYKNWSLAIQLWQVYRNRWLGAFWQSVGISVIPHVRWNTPSSYEFCFQGIPTQSVIAISSQSCQENRKTKTTNHLLFKMGFEAMLQILQPAKILCYGPLQPSLVELAYQSCRAEVVTYPTYSQEIRERLLQKKQEQE